MGIIKAFQKANKVIEDSRREVAKPKQQDEVAAKRQQRKQAGEQR